MSQLKEVDRKEELLAIGVGAPIAVHDLAGEDQIVKRTTVTSIQMLWETHLAG